MGHFYLYQSMSLSKCEIFDVHVSFFDIILLLEVSNMLYFYISLFVMCSLITTYLATPAGKGKVGEFIVSRQIGKDKPGQSRKINNILFEGEKRSAQIDHVVVNKDGVFVIETKNYGGRIYGSENDYKWTQVLAYAKKKFSFYNPIKQNYTHVQQLLIKLGPEFQYVPIFSIIVFTGRSDISHVSTTGTIITTPGKVKKIIRKINSPVILSDVQIEDLASAVICIKKRKDVTLRQHVNNIQEMKKGIDNNICPRCGGKLVVRYSPYGDFLGCKNYPGCQFSKKI